MTKETHPMTDTETPTAPPEDAIWPIPEGSLLEPGTRAATVAAQGILGELEEATMALLDAAPVKAHPDHPVFVHDLAWMVDALEGIIDKAKVIQAEVASALAHAIPFGTSHVTFPDVRPLTPRWGGERKGWENDLLRDAVRPRLLVDPETGEKRDPEGVLETTLSVVSLIGSNVKTTGLKKLGIDPDDYCHKEKRPPTVQVTKERFG